MALIKCYECSREISDKAPACPHCGAPAEEIPHEVSVNGVIVEKGHTKKGKKEGLWEFSYRDGYVAGALRSKGLYNKDEKCGQWESYYKHGGPEETENYKSGKLHGSYESYHDNGVRQARGTYEDVSANRTCKREK